MNFRITPTYTYLLCKFLFEAAQPPQNLFLNSKFAQTSITNNVLKCSPQASTIKTRIIPNHWGQLMLIIYNLRAPLYHVSASSILRRSSQSVISNAWLFAMRRSDFFSTRRHHISELWLLLSGEISETVSTCCARLMEKGCEREEKHVGNMNREYSYFPIHDGNRFLPPQSSCARWTLPNILLVEPTSINHF